MAVTLLPNYSRCQVRLQKGVDGQGEPVYTTRTFSRIRPQASHQDIYDAITSLLSLQALPVVSLRRIDDGELVSG